MKVFSALQTVITMDPIRCSISCDNNRNDGPSHAILPRIDYNRRQGLSHKQPLSHQMIDSGFADPVYGHYYRLLFHLANILHRISGDHEVGLVAFCSGAIPP